MPPLSRTFRMPPLPTAARHLPAGQPELPRRRARPPRPAPGWAEPPCARERRSGTAPGSAPRGDSQRERGDPARVSRDRGCLVGDTRSAARGCRACAGAAKPAALVLGMRHSIPVLPCWKELLPPH